MIKAYEQTIEDFNIKLRSLKWYEFKRENEIQNNIKYYTELLRIERLK